MKTKLTVLLLFLFGSLIMKPVKSQNVLIGETYNKDTTLSLQMFSQSFGLTASGSFSLYSDSSEVRMVLVTTDGKQYLICDYNSAMIPLNTTYSFANYSLESSYLSSTDISYIELMIVDASLMFDTLKNNLAFFSNFRQMNNQKKIQFDLERLQLVKDQINAKKLSWIADTNSFSNLSYMEKKKLFGASMPNLYGFEYYCGGYFSFPFDDGLKSTYTIVPDFDWRSRHGANNPNSPYFDEDYIDYSGWNTTRVEGQGQPDCWAFSCVYTMEALVNLYYNQHINVNLSEQSVISCSGGQAGGYGGSVSVAAQYIRDFGVVNESCFPYSSLPYPSTPNCSLMCTNPEYRFQGSAVFYFGTSTNADIIKEQIILNGPIVGTLRKWGHAMSLVGYGVVKQGDMIMYGNSPHTGIEYLIDPNSPDIGKSYWIFKQSWGVWGNTVQSPYIYVIANTSNMVFDGFDVPLISSGNTTFTESDISCNDLDGDGYYWWGIGDKPATCLTCPDEEDCDDSNPFLGPYDGVYNCTLLCDNFFNTGGEIEIDQSTTYYSDQFINKNIRIKPGATLTINNCTVQLASETKIIVESGAKLILDKSVLTNQCGKLWQGIELQGNSSLSQLTPGAQGQVILKNGAVIENAIDGITTIANVEDMSSWDWSKTGGIIKAENSTFRNCRRGIQFLTYNNIHPRFGTSLPNMSYIKNCTFETTAALPDGIVPYAFISMYEVNDVKIMGNTFQNIFPSANVFELGNGIISIDSKYSITPICNSGTFPCTSFDKNEFINLGYGIRASATNDMRPITVKNAVFNECHFGIYASTIDYSSIVDNEFIISEWTNGSTKIMMYGYGLYLDQCKHFKTEGNYFHSSNTSRGWTGMYVNNTNIGDLSVTNEVYRNKFENLYSGMVALNNNGGPHQPDGVTFHCDTFYSNTYDIAVLPQPENPSISVIQGIHNTYSPNPKLFVRNWYSADCSLNDENQFKIDYIGDVGNYIFHRTYNQTEYLPQCHDMHVDVQGIGGFTPQTGDCPCKDGYAPSEIKDNLVQVAIKKNEINSLVDGGQTNYLVGIAQSNIPSGQILQTMLEFSPYLSDEVLLALIERPNALPAGTIQQILSANSPLSAEVFTAVQNMHPSLPRGIYNQVAVLQTGEMSDRDMLPVIDAAYTQQERLLKADLIRYYLNDTTSVQPLDSVKKILAESSVIESKMNLVSTYLESKNFNKATALIDSLRIVDNSLNTFARKQSLSVQVSVLPGTNYAILEDSLLMNELNTQALDTLSYGSLYAINTLEWLNDSLHEELTLIPMPGGNYRSQVETPSHTIIDIKNAMLKCFPNPAKEKFNVKYELTPVCSAYYLVVQNVKGQEVQRIYLENCEGEIELIAPSEPGTYYVYIEDCGKTLAVDKIVIVK